MRHLPWRTPVDPVCRNHRLSFGSPGSGSWPGNLRSGNL